jgi:hypothetical protein
VAPELSARELSLERDDDVAIWVVRFSTGFRLPPDGYQVSVVAGDPAAEQTRASLVVEGAAPAGMVETGAGGQWQRVGETGASFDAAGVVRIESPDDAAFTDPASNIWVTVSLPDGSGITQSPLYSVADLVGESGSPGLGVAAWGTVVDSNDVPTGGFVPGDPGPRLELRDGAVVLVVPGPPPTELRGNPATDVIDRIWVGPSDGGAVPYAITINQTRGAVVLYDFSSGFPVALTGSEAAWVVQGLPPGGAPAGPYELVFSLAGLAETAGFSAGDPTVGLSVDRTLALVDGRRVTFAGVTGLVTWFEGAADATLAPIEEDVASLQPTTTVAPGASGSSDGGSALWVVLVVVVVLAGAAAVGAWLWSRRRQDDDEGEHEKEGRRAHVSGVSPDDALSALSRTVEEVSAKIDARTATRTKTISPPTPGSDRARAEAGPQRPRDDNGTD